MGFHHTQKAKYQKLKESGLTAEELKADILANQPADTAKRVPEAEIDQFIAELYKAEQPPATNTSAPSAATNDVPTLVAAIAAAQPTLPPAEQPPAPGAAARKFDYKNLIGNEYEGYIEHVLSLPLFDQRDFECFKAQRVMKELYPGMPNSPWAMVGIEIIADKPLHTTRIDIKTANELNAQLPNSKRIYLLKQ